MADENLPREVTNPVPALTPDQLDYQRGLFERCYLTTGAAASMLTRSGYGYVHRQPDDMWLGWVECARVFYAQTEQLRALILKYGVECAGLDNATTDTQLALRHAEMLKTKAAIDAMLQYVRPKPQEQPCSTA